MSNKLSDNVFERSAAHLVVVPPLVHSTRMVISKMSEAIGNGALGEGSNLQDFIEKQEDTEFIINGGYFYFEKVVETYGIELPDGKHVGDGFGICKIRDYLCGNINATSERIGGWLVQRCRGEPFELIPNVSLNLPIKYGEYKYILSCSPLLIMDGKRVPNPITPLETKEKKGPPGHLGHLNQPNQRSLIGQRDDGSLIFISTQNGIIFEDMQELMEQYDCHTAMALDGGGSTFLWEKGTPKVQGDKTRVVGNSIVVFSDVSYV
jgi:exopolysaccharide biosynthesis protein